MYLNIYICTGMLIRVYVFNATKHTRNTRKFGSLSLACHIHSASHAQQFTTRIMLELGLWTLLLHLSEAATTYGHRLAAVVSRQRHVLINAALAEDLPATPAMCLEENQGT